MQIHPVIGAKTIDYPFAYFYKTNADNGTLMQYKKPQKGDIVTPVSSDQFMFNAFNILPDSILNMKYSTNGVDEKIERWDTYTDAYNQKYFYCAETNSTAYYINDGSMFYFTAFYGNKNSLLYYFYLSAFKIYLGNKQIVIQDFMPLNVLKMPISLKWLHDFAAPFKSFINVEYQSKIEFSDYALNSGVVRFASGVNFNILNKKRAVIESNITITTNGISEFQYKSKNTIIKASCINI
jgi:hypothetical protein